MQVWETADLVDFQWNYLFKGIDCCDYEISLKLLILLLMLQMKDIKPLK